MRRKLFNLGALVSLMLCMVTVALWAISYRRTSTAAYADPIRLGFHFGRLNIGSMGGEIELEMWKPVPFIGEYYRPRWGGFGFTNTRFVLWMSVPDWFIATITLMLPAYWIIRRVRRHQPGFCTVCSYNLHGNTSGVCPECGMAIAGEAGI